MLKFSVFPSFFVKFKKMITKNLGRGVKLRLFLAVGLKGEVKLLKYFLEITFHAEVWRHFSYLSWRNPKNLPNSYFFVGYSIQKFGIFLRFILGETTQTWQNLSFVSDIPLRRLKFFCKLGSS